MMNNPMDNNSTAVILAACLDAINTGQMTVEECLLHHPTCKDELQDLILTAHAIEVVPAILPRPAFRKTARADLLSKLPDRNSATLWEHICRALKIPSTQNQPRMALSWATALIIIALFIFSGVSVAYASASALPGDPLYGVKIAVEDIRLMLAGDEGDIRLYAAYIQTRLREIESLANRGNFAGVPMAVVRYQNDITGLFRTTTRLVQGDESGADAYADMLNEIYRNNMLVLTGILNRVPDQVKPSIQQAIHATGQLNTEKPTDSNQLGKPEEPPVPGQPSNMEKPGNVESPVYDDILDDGTLEGEKPGQYWEFDQDEGLGLDGILGGTSHPVPTGEPGNGSQPYGGGQPDGGGRPENPGGNPDMPGRGH